MGYINEISEEFEPIIIEALGIVDEAGLEFEKDLKFIINPRLKTTLARCHRTNKFKDYILIDFHEGFLKKGTHHELVRTTLHEMIHASGVNGHRGLFKLWADEIASVSDYTITRTAINPASERMSVRYIIKCDNCGAEVKRRKNTKVVRNVRRDTGIYGCGLCGGHLSLVKDNLKSS